MTLTEKLQFIAALGAAAATIWGFIVWGKPRMIALVERWRAKRKARADIDACLSRLPELLSVKGVLDAMNGKLGIISAQVMPNGGSSLADSVKRVEEGLQGVTKTVSAMSLTMRVRDDSDPRRGTFEADQHGLLVDCNKTYLRWTGRTLQEMFGWGWINAVHHDDRERVRDEWQQAIEDCRLSGLRFRLVNLEGDCITVESTATPVPEGQQHPERWVGIMFRVDDVESRAA